MIHHVQTDNRGVIEMFLTDNKRLLDKSDDLTPDSIKFLREQIADETIKKAAPTLLEALEKAREDINWMLNSRQFLNADVFNYIDAAIAAARGDV